PEGAALPYPGSERARCHGSPRRPAGSGAGAPDAAPPDQAVARRPAAADRGQAAPRRGEAAQGTGGGGLTAACGRRDGGLSLARASACCTSAVQSLSWPRPSSMNGRMASGGSNTPSAAATAPRTVRALGSIPIFGAFMVPLTVIGVVATAGLGCFG